MELHVGTARRGDLRAYAKRFDLLELSVARNMPRPNRLREMAGSVPEGFVFSVILPRDAATLEAEVDTAVEAVAALGAKWLVMRTQPAGRAPSPTRPPLAGLVARLPRTPPNAWGTRGPWGTHPGPGP